MSFFGGGRGCGVRCYSNQSHGKCLETIRFSVCDSCYLSPIRDKFNILDSV